MDAEIYEEIGNVARYGLSTKIIGKNDERIALNDEEAITNYAGIIHELIKQDGTRISFEDMVNIAHEQFKAYSEQQLPNGERKGMHLWEVIGYPVIDYTKPDSFSIKDGRLFIECDVIVPEYSDAGEYIGTQIERKNIKVQEVIAPQIMFYAQYWEGLQ